MQNKATCVTRVTAATIVGLSGWMLAACSSKQHTTTNGIVGSGGASAAQDSSGNQGNAGAAGSSNTAGAAGSSAPGSSNAINGTGGTTGSSAGSGTGGTPSQAGMGGSVGAAGEGATATCDKQIPSSMDCAAKLAPGDERTCMLGARKYIVHAGKTMNPCEKVALVIDAHGATETEEQQLGTDKFCASGNICWAGLGSGWAAESDMPGGGFIAVFPQGNNNMWAASDADFMLQIVDEMKKLADIDEKKVYMSGISNGGFLTFQTGCPHSDVFHGMAPVSGGSSCTSVKAPIPLISFDAMPDFAYSGHQSANASVVTANNCKGDAKPWITIDASYTEAVCRTAKQDPMAKIVPCTEVTSAMIMPTVCKIWDTCDGGVKVAWCEVSPNTEHGTSNAALDAHILYENATLLNIPSVAWRFFKMFW
jgi:poly(3-hydroxybutyrate) depolymerase